MKRFLAILLFVPFLLNAQAPYSFSGVDTVLTVAWGYNLYPRSTSQTVDIRNSKFASGESGTYILQSGDDSYNAAQAHNLDGAVIKGNYFDWTGTPGTGGMHANIAGYNSNYDIAYNYYDNSYYGIVHEGGYNDGTPMVNTSGGIRGNIFRNNRAALIVWGYDGTVISNNTFYTSISSGTPLIRVGESNGTTTPAYSKNITITNNVFYTTNNDNVFSLTAGSDTGLVVDYNIYYCTDGANNEPTFNFKGSTYTWTQWRAEGYDTHSQILDPDFIDTINFIPLAQVDFGNDLGDEYSYALDTSSTWVVGSTPDTIQQGDDWQIGAVIYESPNLGGYYVQPSGGSDSNDGSFGSPWATWQHGIDEATTAGDTVYFRGGVWNMTSKVTVNTTSGSYSNHIVYSAYPTEAPILDFSNYTGTGTFAGLDIGGVSYVEFIGLTVRNIPQNVDEQDSKGINMMTCGNIWFTNCTAHGIEGPAFSLRVYDSLYVTNCDSYNNIDSTSPGFDGGRADGFIIATSGVDTYDTARIAYITGCRAWFNSDDGFDIGSTKQIQVSNCWSWSNGRLDGDGEGYKFSYANVFDPSKRRIRNSIAAYNISGGFSDLNLVHATDGPCAEYYNNTAYRNNIGFRGGQITADCGDLTQQVIYKNNLVYNSYNTSFDQAALLGCDFNFPENTVQEYNTWITDPVNPFWDYNPAVTVTDADFSTNDSATIVSQLSASRQSDGSLPTLSTAFKLAEGSDLINAGTDVGLDYNGTAPDLGAFESNYGARTEHPLTGTGTKVMISNGVILHNNE